MIPSCREADHSRPSGRAHARFHHYSCGIRTERKASGEDRVPLPSERRPLSNPLPFHHGRLIQFYVRSAKKSLFLRISLTKYCIGVHVMNMNTKNSDIFEKAKEGRTMEVTLWCVCVTLICVAYGFLCIWLLNDQNRSSFGDMFGALSALFTGLAFALMIITLKMQRKELEYQRQELIQTRNEIKGQKFETGFAPRLSNFLREKEQGRKKLEKTCNDINLLLKQCLCFYVELNITDEAKTLLDSMVDGIGDDYTLSKNSNELQTLKEQYCIGNIDRYKLFKKDDDRWNLDLISKLIIERMLLFVYDYRSLVYSYLSIFLYIDASELSDEDKIYNFNFVTNISDRYTRSMVWYYCQIADQKDFINAYKLVYSYFFYDVKEKRKTFSNWGGMNEEKVTPLTSLFLDWKLCTND